MCQPGSTLARYSGIQCFLARYSGIKCFLARYSGELLQTARYSGELLQTARYSVATVVYSPVQCGYSGVQPGTVGTQCREATRTHTTGTHQGPHLPTHTHYPGYLHTTTGCTLAPPCPVHCSIDTTARAKMSKMSKLTPTGAGINGQGRDKRHVRTRPAEWEGAVVSVVPCLAHSFD